MIALDELEFKDIGRWVVYHSTGGDKTEYGRIKSWNSHFIFAVYGWSAEQKNWENYTGQATRPEDLEWK